MKITEFIWKQGKGRGGGRDKVFLTARRLNELRKNRNWRENRRREVERRKNSNWRENRRREVERR